MALSVRTAAMVAMVAMVAMLMAVRSLSAQEPTPPIARHQEPGEVQTLYQEIASPMVIEVSLGATPRRKSVQDVHAWVATETGKYSCQQARVRAIDVQREEKRGKVILRVRPSLVTEERRQDLDVTVAIVSDSNEIRRKFWESLTVGDDNSTANKLGWNWVGAAMASQSKSPEAEFEFTAQEFAALFGPNRAPSVRVVVKIDE
jgi:hypothetical protein